jgi:hypothetical protein
MPSSQLPGALPFTIVLPALVIAACSKGTVGSEGPRAVKQDPTVAAVSLHEGRVFQYKTDVLAAGDVMKRWHWDGPWEIRSTDGTLVRRMFAPDWSADAPKIEGPHLTVIQDPSRGTIYEAFFVQRTDRAFDLPMTLYFFATRDSQTPLFSLTFTDTTIKGCQSGRVSRGNVLSPGIAQSLIESAQWVAIGWGTAVLRSCP